MTRTEHRTLTTDGRDADLLAQQARARAFNASTILTDRYIDTNPTTPNEER